MKLFHTDFEGKTILRVIASKKPQGVTEVLLAFTDGTEIMLGAGEGGVLVSSPVCPSDKPKLKKESVVRSQ